MALDETIHEQALAWAVRTGNPTFDDWEAFTAWLEQNPRHAKAYDEVAAAVADATDALSTPPIAHNDDEPMLPWRRFRWLGGSVAAAVAAMIAVGMWQARPQAYAIETLPGEVQIVKLDGGGQIELAGDTRLVLDRGEPRIASLEHGQALFTIEHNPAAPFTLTVGEDTLVDVGTVFDVKHTPDGMTIAVAEGAVVFNPKQQNVRVSPGQRLVNSAGSDRYDLSYLPADNVGEWRDGRLTFQDATVEDVAGDLSRMTAVTFAVAPHSANRRVSGSLLVGMVRDDPRALGALLGVSVRHDGETWEISAR